MSAVKTYEVTDLAGPWVAGQKKPKDGRIQLTERQAEHELRLGTIRPVAVEDVKPIARRSRKKKA